MTRRPAARRQHRYREGAQPKEGEAAPDPRKPARNRSWDPGQKGHGGEGLSKGYGGSGGAGTGPSGPDRRK